MKVFIVWSGPRSFEIARALNDWLPRVIQAVKPFFSHEIDKGAKWASEIDAALEGTHLGLVCLTPENLDNNWIHYEVGALSKTSEALIWTYLTDLKNTDVPQPLGKFQHTLANKEQTLRLVRTMNKRLGEVGGEPLPDHLLSDNFELLWPKLDGQLRAAAKAGSELRADERPRDERAMLVEILELVRVQERRDSAEKLNKATALVRQLRFEIPNEREDKESIALGYVGIFSAVGGKASQSFSDNGLNVTIDFAIPILRERVRELLWDGERFTGWNVSSWSMSSPSF